eukprot:5723690-Lingulodinium_polyedra.AAC.1
MVGGTSTYPKQGISVEVPDPPGLRAARLSKGQDAEERVDHALGGTASGALADRGLATAARCGPALGRATIQR